MKRKPNPWWKQKQKLSSKPAPEYLKLSEDEAADKFIAFAKWLPREHALWFKALYKLDKRRDLSPLIELLKPVVPAKVYPHLVQLSERYHLKFKRGKARTTPSYNRTLSDILLEIYCDEVRYWVAEGMTVAESIEYVAKNNPVPESVLRQAYRGSHRSISVMKKRRQSGLK
jgi:hypothetical protein